MVRNGGNQVLKFALKYLYQLKWTLNELYDGMPCVLDEFADDVLKELFYDFPPTFDDGLNHFAEPMPSAFESDVDVRDQ